MTEAEQDDGDEAEEAQRQRDDVLVDRHLTMLMEHFDAVRIFVTRPAKGAPGRTAMYSAGKGNYYAQRGMIDHWITMERSTNNQPD